jgi:hypothetical protein
VEKCLIATGVLLNAPKYSLENGYSRISAWSTLVLNNILLWEEVTKSIPILTSEGGGGGGGHNFFGFFIEGQIHSKYPQNT